MTVWIAGFSTLRDYLFHHVLQTQHTHPVLESLSSITHPLAYALYAVGGTLVVSSFYQLGITGTFLGDYVGILMDAPVRSFPFSVLSDPMYVGATLNFFASALLYDSPAGLLLAALVGVVYAIAAQFEGAYTSSIYQQREVQRKAKGKKAQ
ncbi:Phosphatidyl-N-methylethanolamine N-methyltransferase [Xylographa carneopallida]|nr:Phosphatidyl-N-methylethanolamine N-methyltransferase [Xylographa carneopallida]